MMPIFLSVLLLSPFNYCPIAKGVEVRRKIVMVDTGIARNQENHIAACKDGHFSFNDSIYSDYHLHGENVFGLIAENLNTEKYCITSVKFYENAMSRDYRKALLQLDKINNLEAINLSLASEGYDAFEHDMFKKLVARNVRLIAAAGNEGKIMNREECDIYPACLKIHIPEMTVVGSNTGNYSNLYTSFQIKFEDGTNKGIGGLRGTSQSTALYTGKEYSK